MISFASLAFRTTAISSASHPNSFASSRRALAFQLLKPTLLRVDAGRRHGLCWVPGFVYFDPVALLAGSGICRLGQCDPENAVLKLRGYLVRIDFVGNRYRPLKGAIGALNAVYFRLKKRTASRAEHYAHFFRTEVRAFDKAVTDWEQRRYFERI